MGRHRLVRLTAHGLGRRCGMQAGGHILTAVSGGCDSVALLMALDTIAGQRRWGLKLTVGHVHHHLRGPDADRDAAFVRALADRLDRPFEQRDIRPGGESGNLEANARRMRYAALADIAQTCGAGWIATAHHGDDQIETLLMRALRGSSAEGLRGIAWRRRLPSGHTLIRPMLLADRALVMDYLAQLGQPHREDRTNMDTSRLRARLRRDVLPVLRELSNDPAKRAAALSEHMRDLHRLVEEQIDAALRGVADGELSRASARAMSRVVLTGVLRRMLLDAGAAPDRLGRRTLNDIARAAQDGAGGSRRFELSGGTAAEVTPDVVRVLPRVRC